MLFHLTREDDIRVIHEQGPAQTDAGGSTFACEQELKLCRQWPIKRLIEIGNRLPGVQAVARFTDRKTAIARIWRAIQPPTELDRTTERRRLNSMPLSSRREFLARARLVVLLGTALPALAQVPGDFVKITNLELSSGTPTLEYENVGQKPITAFAIENLRREHKGELVIVEYPYGSLAPAERRGGLQVWKGLDPAQLDQQLKVVAVIYDDGTHLGGAPDPAYKGTDVIAEIFEARKGRADEWAKWKDFISHLPQDDDLALAQFFKAAEQLHVDTTSYGQYDSGVNEARAAIQASAKRMQDALAAQIHSAASLRSQMRTEIPHLANQHSAAAHDAGGVR